MYELFDQLLLISLGNVVYSGAGSEAIEYFADQGYLCPHNYNPSEYFLEVMTSKTFALGESPSDPHLAYLERLNGLTQYYNEHIAANICRSNYI